MKDAKKHKHWDVYTLKKYFERVIDDRNKFLDSLITQRDRTLDQAIVATNLAIEKADTAIRAYFERIVADRVLYIDKMMQVSDDAAIARLEAQRQAVAAALAASDKAIEKSESAQKEYNARSNEFRSALDDQQKNFLSRTESDVRFQQLRDLVDTQGRYIIELQKSESRGEGSNLALTAAKAQTTSNLGLIITVTVWALGGLATLVFFLATRK
jgi:hypothetical protein